MVKHTQSVFDHFVGVALKGLNISSIHASQTASQLKEKDLFYD